MENNILQILTDLIQELNIRPFSSDNEKKAFVRNFLNERGVNIDEEIKNNKDFLSSLPPDLRFLISQEKKEEENIKEDLSSKSDNVKTTDLKSSSEYIKESGQQIVNHVINKIEGKTEPKESQFNINVLFEGDEDIFIKVSRIPSNFILFNEQKDISILTTLRGKDQEKYLNFLNSPNRTIYEIDNQKLISSSRLSFATITDINVIYYNVKKFLLLNFTNLTEEEIADITVQDSLFLTSFIASGLSGNPINIFATCDKDDSVVKLSVDLNNVLEDFSILDIKELEDYLNKFNMTFIKDEKSIMYEDELYLIKFEFPSFVYEPIIFESNPLLLLSTLIKEFTNKKTNKSKVFSKTSPLRQSAQIVENLKTSLINKIYEGLIVSALGFGDKVLYGIDLTKSRQFICPKHNDKIEVLNLHIFLQFFRI